MTAQPITFERLTVLQERKIEAAKRHAHTVLVGKNIPIGLNSLDGTVKACEQGLRRVIVEPTIDLSDERGAPHLGLIRDLASCGVHVEWTLADPGALEISALFALPPPQPLNLPNEAVERWRKTYRFGVLYYRSGPGFLIVNDSRSGETNEIRIRQGRLMSAFLACDRGRDVGMIANDLRTILLAEALVCPVGSNLVSLACRMHHWPVPCTSV